MRKVCGVIKVAGLAFTDDESGQGLVEYSLITAFVATLAIVAVTFLGSDMSLALRHIGSSL